MENVIQTLLVKFKICFKSVLNLKLDKIKLNLFRSFLQHCCSCRNTKFIGSDFLLSHKLMDYQHDLSLQNVLLHSLEDFTVPQMFANRDACVCICERSSKVKLLSTMALRPTLDEADGSPNVIVGLLSIFYKEFLKR